MRVHRQGALLSANLLGGFIGSSSLPPGTQMPRDKTQASQLETHSSLVASGNREALIWPCLLLKYQSFHTAAEKQVTRGRADRTAWLNPSHSLTWRAVSK